MAKILIRNKKKGSNVSLMIAGRRVSVTHGTDFEVPDDLKSADIRRAIARHPNLELSSDEGVVAGAHALPGYSPHLDQKHRSLLTPSEGAEIRRAQEALDPASNNRQTVITPPGFVDRPSVNIPTFGGVSVADEIAAGNMTIEEAEAKLQPGAGTGSMGGE